MRAVSASAGDDVLAIPVVQGESVRAHRNRLVGTLRLGGINCDLPAGTRVEVTLELDRSGQLHTRADVPAAGQTFGELAHVLVPTATVATAERELAATSSRAGDVQRRTFQLGVPAAVKAIGDVSALLAEAERAVAPARDGDLDAAQKLHRLLIDANLALDEAEAILEWPDIDAEARRCSLFYTPLVAEWGRPRSSGSTTSSWRRRRRRAVDATPPSWSCTSRRCARSGGRRIAATHAQWKTRWRGRRRTSPTRRRRPGDQLARPRARHAGASRGARESVLAARAGRADLGPVPEQPRAAAPELRLGSPVMRGAVSLAPIGTLELFALAPRSGEREG